MIDYKAMVGDITNRGGGLSQLSQYQAPVQQQPQQQFGLADLERLQKMQRLTRMANQKPTSLAQAANIRRDGMGGTIIRQNQIDRAKAKLEAMGSTGASNWGTSPSGAPAPSAPQMSSPNPVASGLGGLFQRFGNALSGGSFNNSYSNWSRPAPRT